jgi:4-hydroxy 2-oxovalerate aldolase
MGGDFRIHDVSLRDGNHAVGHGLSPETAVAYARAAIELGIQRLEVGHGNGLGGSSASVGLAAFSDLEIIAAVRQAVPEMEIAAHSIPAFASVSRQLVPAIDAGVEFFRVAAHCSEADTTEVHIRFLRERGVSVAGALMMVSRITPPQLVQQALLMQNYGAMEIVFMDSTGRLLPTDVREIASAARGALDVPFGFHAHDNLGLAVWNSVTAAEEGASFVDGSILGFGAGAGNARLEILAKVFELRGLPCGINSRKALELAQFARDSLGISPASSSPEAVALASADLFSGFLEPVMQESKTAGVSFFALAEALAEKKLVAGQEDVVRAAARGVSPL